MSSLLEQKLELESQARDGNPEALKELDESICARALPVERFICIARENAQFRDAVAAVRNLADQGDIRAQDLIFRWAQVLHEPSLELVQSWWVRRDAFALQWLLTASSVFLPFVDSRLNIQSPQHASTLHQALDSTIRSASGQKDRLATPQRMVLVVFRHYVESVLPTVLPPSWISKAELRTFCRTTINMVRSLCTQIELDLTDSVRKELMRTSDMYKSAVTDQVWGRGK